jgi:predicted TIM-barrel fold metal-dependent hydrolase
MPTSTCSTPDRLRYGWCEGLPALANRPFRLEEYRAAAAGTGIARTLFMETAVDDDCARAETDLLLALAGDPANRIAGVLATARPEEADFPAQLEAMLHPRLRGLRRVLHVVPDAVSQAPCFAPNLALLAQYRLTFESLPAAAAIAPGRGAGETGAGCAIRP